MTHSKPLPVVLVHQMPGRARLHLEIEEGQEDAAQRLLHALAEHPAVQEARPSARARSVLVLHSGEIGSILDDAQARGLMILQAHHVASAKLSLRGVKRALDSLDTQLRERTDGGVDLPNLAFVALTAAGVWQALNGHLLPAGTTLFNYALGVMQWGAERDAPTYPTSKS